MKYIPFEEELAMVTDSLQEHIVCPDGRTFMNAIEAAHALSTHWGSAGYVHEWFMGIICQLEQQFESCNAYIWEEDHDYGFRLYPCTGGIIEWSNSTLAITEDKKSSMLEENIRAYILPEEEFKKREHSIALTAKLRNDRYLREGWVYTPTLSDIEGNLTSEEFGTPLEKVLFPADEAERYFDAAWKHWHGRAPKDYDLINEGDTTTSLDTSDLWDVVTNQGDTPTRYYLDNSDVWDVGQAIRHVNVKTWLRFVNDQVRQGSLHDRITLLKAAGRWSIGQIETLLRYMKLDHEEWTWNDVWGIYGRIPVSRLKLLTKSRTREFIATLGRIPESICLDKETVKTIYEIGSRFYYDNIVDDACATAAHGAHLSQEEFNEYQNYWLKRLHKGYESIPYVGVVEEDGYKMYRLETDDARGPLLGIYTDCCQHPAGAGRTCARHGMESPDGAFFVVEKMGKIIAQSWAWRNRHVVCFDNIEALGVDRLYIIARLYERCAQRLIGKLGIERVHVGTGYDDVGVRKYWNEVEKVEPPKDCYTDAMHQCIIASKIYY